MPFWLARPIFWFLFHTVYLLYGGVRFEGRENVPLKGGVLITPNHISDSDPPTVGIALPRACWVMAKEEIFGMGFVGKISRWLHGFPVKRYSADRAALRKAEDLLKNGEAVVIFPEGKLSEDGKLQPLLPGTLLIARAANVPIIPTILIGTDNLMPYAETRPRRMKQPAIVRFGKPITMAELTSGYKGSEGLRVGAERLRQIMLAMQAGLPAPTSFENVPKAEAGTDISRAVEASEDEGTATGHAETSAI